jgi:N-acetylmuramoyl-L-alanine amidase
MRKIDRVIIHCSASDFPRQTAQWIDAIHRERGFDKIGYTFFIRNCGLIEQGRYLDEVGAHTRGLNKKSIGICLAGETAFFPAQFKSLFLLLSVLKLAFPKATLHGHNEFNANKTCPNINLSPIKEVWDETSRQGKKFSQIKKIQSSGGWINYFVQE